MKQIVFSVIITFAASAWAQAPKEPAKPAAPAKEAMKESAKPEATKEPARQAAGPRKPRRWNEDARHCLERGTTTEIIKCAEEYL